MPEKLFEKAAGILTHLLIVSLNYPTSKDVEYGFFLLQLRIDEMEITLLTRSPLSFTEQISFAWFKAQIALFFFTLIFYNMKSIMKKLSLLLLFRIIRMII
jgi:hypothetical protein